MRVLALAAALCSVAASALAQGTGEARPRAVIELFTSQGCSSCPPADRLMAELARDPSLIVLTLPVHYWDYLGWKDTLAHGAFAYRQKAYSGMRGDRQVYTPQAVVNGVAHAVGSDRAEIERLVSMTRGVDGTLTAEIRILGGGGALVVECPERPFADGAAHLWALPIAAERTVQIGRGENSGRSVTYVNVVRGLSRIGSCVASGQRVEVPSWAMAPDADALIVLLQAGTERKAARILAAARHSSR